MENRVYQVSEIKSLIQPIAEKYGAERIYLFGSYARGTARDDSDIDLRIDRGQIKGMFALSGLRLDVLDALGKNVDLITTGSLDEDFLNEIRKEEILIYGKN